MGKNKISFSFKFTFKFPPFARGAEAIVTLRANGCFFSCLSQQLQFGTDPESVNNPIKNIQSRNKMAVDTKPSALGAHMPKFGNSVRKQHPHIANVL